MMRGGILMTTIVSTSSAAILNAASSANNAAGAESKLEAKVATPAADPRPAALSPAAAAVVLQEQNQPTASAAKPEPERHSVWQTFIVIRDGFSNYDLAAGVDDPNYVSNSAGLDDVQLKANVRARLDANIKKMADSGDVYGTFRSEGMDYDTLVSGLDPRSLKLIRDSGNDTFNSEEKTAAAVLLEQQDRWRSGCIGGPNRLMPLFLSMGLGDLPPKAREDQLAFLTGEQRKQAPTVENKISEASVRVQLGSDKANALLGQIPPQDKMLSLLVEAMQQAREKDPYVLEKASRVRSLDDLRKQDWFQPSLDKLNAILDEQAKQQKAAAESAAPGAQTAVAA